MMDKLSARIEAADGPSRELDGLIFKAIFPDRDWVQFDDCWGARCEDDGCAFDMPFHYTASIDAAMMLVPEGWHVVDFGEVAIEEKWRAGLWEHISSGEEHSMADTPALAIAAAALKARGL